MKVSRKATAIAYKSNRTAPWSVAKASTTRGCHPACRLFFYVRCGVSYHDLKEIWRNAASIRSGRVEPLGDRIRPFAGRECPKTQAANRPSWRMDEIYVKVKASGCIGTAPSTRSGSSSPTSTMRRWKRHSSIRKCARQSAASRCRLQ